MEPTGEARGWIGDLLGASVDDHLSRAAEAWPSLGPALAAVHEAAVPAETEPAVQLQIPFPTSR